MTARAEPGQTGRMAQATEPAPAPAPGSLAPLAALAACALTAPTLLAWNVPPSTTFINQALAVAGWGVFVAALAGPTGSVGSVGSVGPAGPVRAAVDATDAVTEAVVAALTAWTTSTSSTDS